MDIFSFIFHDLYAVLSQVDKNTIHAKIYYQPMISFIWLSQYLDGVEGAARLSIGFTLVAISNYLLSPYATLNLARYAKSKSIFKIINDIMGANC